MTIAVAPGELSVADRGPGIPEDELPRAFERFHLRARAGNASPDGAGLGLAIVRELTEAMGGSASGREPPRRRRRLHDRLPARAAIDGPRRRYPFATRFPAAVSAGLAASRRTPRDGNDHLRTTDRAV